MDLLMAMVGEQFGIGVEGEQICGAVVNIRAKGDKVQYEYEYIVYSVILNTLTVRGNMVHTYSKWYCTTYIKSYITYVHVYG